MFILVDDAEKQIGSAPSLQFWVRGLTIHYLLRGGLVSICLICSISVGAWRGLCIGVCYCLILCGGKELVNILEIAPYLLSLNIYWYWWRVQLVGLK